MTKGFERLKAGYANFRRHASERRRRWMKIFPFRQRGRAFRPKGGL
jgi:hypothetical protein